MFLSITRIKDEHSKQANNSSDRLAARFRRGCRYELLQVKTNNTHNPIVDALLVIRQAPGKLCNKNAMEAP